MQHDAAVSVICRTASSPDCITDLGPYDGAQQPKVLLSLCADLLQRMPKLGSQRASAHVREPALLRCSHTPSTNSFTFTEGVLTRLVLKVASVYST
jgi:hypothetical protein